MALLCIKCVKTEVERRGCYEFFRSARFGSVLSASMSALADGRLPGDWGDDPEAVDTGERDGKHLLSCIEHSPDVAAHDQCIF